MAINEEEKVLTYQLRNELIDQMHKKEKGSIYHWSQTTFAYNSNKIEGSRLTEEQTEQIFDSDTIFVDKNESAICVDDLIEARNHFRLFDYMLLNLAEPLSKEMMIKMNTILKHGTTYEYDPKYNVGGFKVRKNQVGFINPFHTTSPEDVEKEIELLLHDWYSKKEISINDIAEFHVRFERIHPFGDGNGRVGRIIMFKQCIENDVFPFILMDTHRPYYIRGLREWDNQPNYLIDTLLTEQDTYKGICEYLDIFENELNCGKLSI